MRRRRTPPRRSRTVIPLASEESHKVEVDLAAEFNTTYNLTAAKRGEVVDQVDVSDFLEVCKCNQTLHCNSDPLKQGEELHICAKP